MKNREINPEILEMLRRRYRIVIAPVRFGRHHNRDERPYQKSGMMLRSIYEVNGYEAKTLDPGGQSESGKAMMMMSVVRDRIEDKSEFFSETAINREYEEVQL